MTENIEFLVEAFGCRVGSLPSSYLGLPLGAPFKSILVREGVEERLRKRLALWKRQYISKGGRLTLIRSTLSSMPICYMSLFRIPRIVRLRLEKIWRDFFWGGGNMENKPHLVNRDTVCSAKMGWGGVLFGLGVRRLDCLNRTLLGK